MRGLVVAYVLNLTNRELRGLERREADFDVDDAELTIDRKDG